MDVFSKKKINVVAFWWDELHLVAELQVHLDTTGSLGLGAFYHRQWCVKPWPQLWVDRGWTWDLTFIEVFPILLAVWMWGEEMANCTIHF